MNKYYPTPKSPTESETLTRVAEEFGTPTYVYFERIIRERISTLRKYLEGIPFQLSYACKANGSLPVLRVMREENLGVDAVSPAELEVALRVGFQRDRILFSANNMTDQEMSEALDCDVLLNIGGLSRLERFGQTHPGARVSVRLNPQIGAGHHNHVITAGPASKFGIGVENIDEIQSIASRHGLRVVGLHQHIGSGILDTEILGKAISVMLDAALRFDQLRFINLGGGLGIPYRPNESALDFDAWHDKIVLPLKDFLEKHPSDQLTFVFEPGRFLVAESGSLLVRVNTIKKTPGQTFAGVDSGMGHLARPAIYGAYHEICNLTNPDGARAPYDVVGNICESADFFARDRLIQEIREGDLLCILDTGAYGMSMASMYNTRPLPSEVWIPASGEEPQLISERETTADLVDRLYPELRS